MLFQLKPISDQMQEMPQGKECPRKKIEGSKLFAGYELALVLCVCVCVCVCVCEHTWFLLVRGESKLVKMACSGSLAPCFINDVNKDYATAEITYITVHAHQEALAWSQTTLCSTHV